MLAFMFLLACSTQNKTIADAGKTTADKDTIRIVNDSLEYEVIIIDTGFDSWLASRAYPRNYYSQTYLELKNRQYVIEWNIRATQPQRYHDLYGMTIDYDFQTNYGYEVNYLLYNYMVFFQNKYNQKLAGHVPER
jgi:hypothetical protein